MPFLPAELVRKITILGHSTKSIRAAVHEAMTKERAPMFLGGEICESFDDGTVDPHCRSRILPYGPCFPRQGCCIAVKRV